MHTHTHFPEAYTPIKEITLLCSGQWIRVKASLTRTELQGIPDSLGVAKVGIVVSKVNKKPENETPGTSTTGMATQSVCACVLGPWVSR